MSVIFTTNQERFEEQIRELIALTGKSAQEALRAEGSLFVKDVIRMTPPFSTAPNTESYNVQRRTGESAVERDIRRLFKVLDANAIEKIKNPELKRGIKRAYRTKDFEALRVLIKKANPESAKQLLGVLEQADPQLHKRWRDRRGRIQSPLGKFWVLHDQGLKRYITAEKKHVGKAKAGWFAAARALGVKLPNWITRHTSPGQFIDRTNDPKQPSVTIGNLVDYVQGSGSDLRIVERALQNRNRNLKTRLEWIFKNGWKRR